MLQYLRPLNNTTERKCVQNEITFYSPVKLLQKPWPKFRAGNLATTGHKTVTHL